ncbi:MAG: amino acid racemase [Alicyclobacillus sp.]|nr:amino acid racemase [Alicyclobacillus sp.]
MKTIGIIGGLGPLAGAHFYRRLVERTPADSDEEHIPVVLVSDPTVPSRIDHLSGRGESPLPKLVSVCQRMVQAGADAIALPSTTTSIYQPMLAEQVPVPILSLIEEVADVVAVSGCRRVGVLGTTPTRTFAVYEQAFAARGITAVYPDEASQAEVMAVIHAVKGASGRTASQRAVSGVGTGLAEVRETASGTDAWAVWRAQMAEVASRPWAVDVDGLLLGCTELPVLFPDERSQADLAARCAVFSSTDILAAATVRFALGDVAVR